MAKKQYVYNNLYGIIYKKTCIQVKLILSKMSSSRKLFEKL